MPMTLYGFKRPERLKSLKVISRLFKDGNSFAVYPVRLVWLPLAEENLSEAPVQFAVSVPKKNFKSAVARNRIKRKLREAWRLNKHRIYRKLVEVETRYAFMVLYTAREDMSFDQIEKAMQTMIRIFIRKNVHPATNAGEHS